MLNPEDCINLSNGVTYSMMQPVQPMPPRELNALAAEVLERLRGKEASENIIIGGGVALQHYCPYRSTFDLDGWWRDRSRIETESLLEKELQEVARIHGWNFRRRAFGDTQSYELIQTNHKVFSVQLAVRSVALDDPLPSAWEPVLLETFRDNLGAKMNALAGRGAPRDFMDVYEVCLRGLASPDDCWTLWSQKNPGGEIDSAKSRVILHLEQISARRPLHRILDPGERAKAERLRNWVHNTFCATGL